MKNNTGALKDTYDPRDYQWKNLAKGKSEFNWEEGFDIEKKLGHRILPKDQNGSFSCGGQAWAYYGEVLEELYDGTYNPMSAKFIYAHTVAPGGGSAGRTNCDFVIKNGWGLESLTPSYDNGNAPDEPFMTRIDDITEEAYKEAKKNKALVYANTGTYIDDVAQAIKENNGVIIGIDGQDNGTWRTEFPAPPNDVTSSVWRHWVYAGKAKIIDGKKHIGFINSWGSSTGKNGWQWISEDYFNTYVPRYREFAVWSGWTLVYLNTEIKKTQLSLVEALKSLVSVYGKLINKFKK